jgi:hypothetical protein
MDQMLDELIAKIVKREASREDLISYQEIVASRTRMMRLPSIRSRSVALRRKYA